MDIFRNLRDLMTFRLQMTSKQQLAARQVSSGYYRVQST